ncbi:amino acid ABC transporter substrate-binding protein [Halobellus rubicundus]|uniref:Amino acid ABC transporter substrate-binding protein n=1 Tax=Halobellus rubicundus TaxID=2996466 RepID=A0ABD5MAA8_9EURY
MSSQGGSSEPITIGTTLPESGSYSSMAKHIRAGYEMGVQYVNDNGGIDGRPLELIIKDDESEAQKTRSGLNEIVSNNDVAMLWGSFSSLLVTAGSAFAESQELPFIGTTFAYQEPHQEKNYKWTFAPFPKSRDQVRTTKSWFDALDDGPERIAIWELNSGWGEELANLWEQSFKGTDYEVVLRQKYQIGNSDFTTLISQTQDADADAILSNPVPPDGITAAKQMKQQGYTPNLVNFIRATDPRAWTTALGGTGDYFASTGVGWLAGLDTTGTGALIERYHDRQGVSGDAVPVNSVGAAFTVVQVAASALRTAGSTDPSAVRDALLNQQFDTVMGQFGFDDTGMPKEGEMVPAVRQWQDGKQMLVHPEPSGDYAMEPEYPMPTFDSR